MNEAQKRSLRSVAKHCAYVSEYEPLSGHDEASLVQLVEDAEKRLEAFRTLKCTATDRIAELLEGIEE